MRLKECGSLGPEAAEYSHIDLAAHALVGKKGW